MTRRRGKRKLQCYNILPPPLERITSDMESDTSELQAEKPNTAAGEPSKDKSNDEFTSVVNHFLPASDLDIDELLSTLDNEYEDCDWPTSPLTQNALKSSMSTDCPGELLDNALSLDLRASPQAPSASARKGKRLFSEIPNGPSQESRKRGTDALYYEREPSIGDGVRRINTTRLRTISQIVTEKVRERRQTTYDEVAEEVVAEYESMQAGDPSSSSAGGKLSAAVVKNIKRRVYDCLNVMDELKLISKETGSRRISWLNEESAPEELLRTPDLSTLEKRKLNLQNSLKKKESILRRYKEEVEGLQNLSERNQRNYHALGHLPDAHLMLPFTLLEISGPGNAVDCTMTDNREMLHIQSNSEFFLHSGGCVARSMSKIQK